MTSLLPISCLLALLSSLGVFASPFNVELLWGLPDAVAYVGKAFKYSMPADAFKGNIHKYKINDVLSEGLPAWLDYDERTGAIFGVPSGSDLGPHNLRVEVYSVPINSTHARMVVDATTITVKEETFGSRMVASLSDSDAARNRSSSKKSLVCDKDTPVVVFTVVLEEPRQVRDGKPADNLRLLDSVAEQFGVEQEELRLYDRDYVNEHGGRSVLKAGSVGNKRLNPKDLGSILVSWPIGCGHNLDAEGRLRVQDLTEKARAGPSSIISWNVATHLLPAHQRKRRSIEFLKTAFQAGIPGPQATTPGTTTTVLITTTTTATTTTTPTTITTTTTATTPSTTQQVPSVPEPVANEKPRPRSDDIIINCHVGRYCDYQFNENVFTDKEDGNAHNLKLEFASLDKQERPWIVFSPEKLLVEALVSPTERERSIKYRLTAVDSGGAPASIIVIFNFESDEKDISGILHLFSVTLNQDFDAWVADGARQVLFFSRLAKFLGGSTDQITVTSMERGSVRMGWKNHTFEIGNCARDRLSAIGRKLVSDKGQATNQLKTYMGDFHVTNASYESIGACVPVERRTTPVTPQVSDSPDAKPASDANFYTTAIPIIVIVALLLLAAIVAICLWRRSKKGKKTSSPNQAYMSRGGKPVVFPGEVHEPNEDRNATTTSPMLLKEERPPLQSTDFAASGGVSTFGRGPDTSIGVSPLYSPPPHPAADASLNGGSRSPRPRTSTPQNARNQNLHLPP